MLRKILIGAGVVVAVVLAALLALLLLVDVNRFKPELQQLVHDRTGRRLSIDGELGLSVFPRIAVTLPRTRLSERGSEADFAALDEARVAVALWPLLAGRVEAQKVTLFGLTATVERRADGSTSIDDLLGREAAAAPGAGAAPPAPGAAVPAFEIAGVELAKASLTLKDAAAGTTITIAPLDLSVGRLANVATTPVTLAARVASTQPAAQAELKLAATVDFDLARGAYGARGLEATLAATLDGQALQADVRAEKLGYEAGGAASAARLELRASGSLAGIGLDETRLLAPAVAFDLGRQRLSVTGLEAFARGQRGADRFDASLSAPRIEISPQGASGERVLAAARLEGGQDADLKLTLEGLAGTAAALRIERLAVALTARQGGRRLAASLSSPAVASLEAQTFALQALAGELGLEDPALPAGPVKLPIDGRFALDARAQTVDLRLATRLDEAPLKAELGVRGFGPMQLRIDAQAERLDLDRLLPPAQPSATPAPPAAGEAAADPPVDLGALKSLDLQADLRVGQFKARGLRASRIHVGARATGGRLELAPLAAALYGGTLEGRASAAADGNRLALAATLAGVSIEPLLKDALGRDLLQGSGNVRLDLRTGGASVGALTRALEGSVAVRLRDGAIKGINLAQKLRDAQSLVGKGPQGGAMSGTEKTDFSELAASATIAGGVARSDDLELKSPLLRVGGAGQADLGARRLDYTARVSVVGTLTGQDGKQLTALRGVTVPVRLDGPFDQLAWGIDWNAVAQQALKSKVVDEAKARLAPKVEEQRERLKDQARDALKGLLGR